MQNIKILLSSNAPIKVISFMLGFLSWFLLVNSHTETITKEVPLSFYGISKKWIVRAPEKVMVTLSGKRSYLRTLDINTLALHINGTKLKPGVQPINLSTHQLFVPNSIKLIHYIPTTLSVELIKNNT